MLGIQALSRSLEALQDAIPSSMSRSWFTFFIIDECMSIDCTIQRTRASESWAELSRKVCFLDGERASSQLKLPLLCIFPSNKLLIFFGARELSASDRPTS